MKRLPYHTTSESNFKQLMNQGLLTVNEVREHYGYPTIEGGDVLFIPKRF